VANADKILSLYEADVEVLKRGKAGANVEFGNKLWIGETQEGLIVDYKLLRESEAAGVGSLAPSFNFILSPFNPPTNTSAYPLVTWSTGKSCGK